MLNEGKQWTHETACELTLPQFRKIFTSDMTDYYDTSIVHYLVYRKADLSSILQRRYKLARNQHQDYLAWTQQCTQRQLTGCTCSHYLTQTPCWEEESEEDMKSLQRTVHSIMCVQGWIRGGGWEGKGCACPPPLLTESDLDGCAHATGTSEWAKIQNAVPPPFMNPRSAPECITICSCTCTYI